MTQEDTNKHVTISPDLIKAIRTFPLSREVEHCNKTISISPFDIYAICPTCEAKIKVRLFAASFEIEDVFDAVFEWLIKTASQELYQKRQKEILEDLSDS